jgi:hypothetical protein
MSTFAERKYAAALVLIDALRDESMQWQIQCAQMKKQGAYWAPEAALQESQRTHAQADRDHEAIKQEEMLS